MIKFTFFKSADKRYQHLEDQLVLAQQALTSMDKKFHDKYPDSVDGAEWIDHCQDETRAYLIERIEKLKSQLL